MIRKPLALACAAAFVLAACNQQPAAEPGPATGPAPDAAPAEPEPAATLIPTGPADAAGDFDPRAFAGRFSGTLPCASCPGIDATLQLDPDGSYTLSEVYREEEDGAFEGQGTWTAEADGTRIRLDPGSKSEEDQVYAIASPDRLVPLDAQGRPAENAADYGLSRSAPAPAQ